MGGKVGSTLVGIKGGMLGLDSALVIGKVGGLLTWYDCTSDTAMFSLFGLSSQSALMIELEECPELSLLGPLPPRFGGVLKDSAENNCETASWAGKPN